jgi:hypothetical protein
MEEQPSDCQLDALLAAGPCPARLSPLEPATSSRFFEAYRSGDRKKNPGGMGGFPLSQASSAAGRQICEDRARRNGDTFLVEGHQPDIGFGLLEAEVYMTVISYKCQPSDLIGFGR